MALLILAPVVVAGGAFLAWRQHREAPQPETSITAVGAAPQIVRALGYVEPISEIRRLVFKVDGVIEECRVAVGQSVKKGDVLMRLNSEREQAALKVADEALAVAEAELRQLLAGVHPEEIAAAEEAAALWQERHQFAERRLNRIKNLQQTNAVTEDERDLAETEVVSAKRNWQRSDAIVRNLKTKVREEDRQLAENKVQQATAQVNLARQQLADATLVAPFDGAVLDILRREGEGPRLLDREPVMLFADTTQLRVRAEVDERFVARVREGQPASLYGRGLGDAKFHGNVAQVKGVMGNKTVFARDADDRKDLDTIEVLIDAPPEFRAPIGLQVDVDIRVSNDRP
jgi:multidrug resistance efflux pump